MNNILVTGANGQLGSELQSLAHQYPSYNFFFTSSVDLDITNLSQVETFCFKNYIHTIINCAAYTAVDKAEKEIELCNAVNNTAVKHLSHIAKTQNIKLIHISTDYVFSGIHHTAFKENDITNPINTYGKTKLLGEQAILDTNPKNSIIIRTSWVYSSFGNNFVKTMLNLAKIKTELNIIVDQIGTPTYAFDLAKTILDIVPKINNTNTEIYHYSNEGVCSWYDFAFEIFNQQQIDCTVLPIETKDYPTPAKRPLFSMMNKSKIKNTFDLKIPHWRTSLSLMLKKNK